MAGRVLGIDVGTRRIGVALADPSGTIAQPLRTIERRGEARAIDDLVRVIAEQGVGEVVVGLPRRTDGREGPEAEAVRVFAAKLAESAGKVTLTFWDERFTTSIAQNVLIDADVSRKGRRQVVDQLAAALILQSVLDSRKIR